jgi:putative transposase
MSRNYYAEINLHMVWHTRESYPLLTSDVETFTHHYLRGRVIITPGVYIHEIGGIETHVHLVVSIPPTIVISELIGQLKGSSSHEANKQFGRKVLE